MKAASMFIIVITILVAFSAATTQAQNLNVTFRGLDSDETRLIKSELTEHGLPITTPVIIEKGVVKGELYGKIWDFNSIKVTIETKDGKFAANVDDRNYPQIHGEEYYGLLRLGLSHACQGPASARYAKSADSVFVQIEKTIRTEAKKRGYSVNYFSWSPGTSNADFEINEAFCHVHWSPSEGKKLPAYQMVRNGMMQPVSGLPAIFAAIPKVSMSKK